MWQYLQNFYNKIWTTTISFKKYKDLTFNALQKNVSEKDSKLVEEKHYHPPTCPIHSVTPFHFPLCLSDNVGAGICQQFVACL
jgi:hypothetical protein